MFGNKSYNILRIANASIDASHAATYSASNVDNAITIVGSPHIHDIGPPNDIDESR